MRHLTLSGAQQGGKSSLARCVIDGWKGPIVVVLEHAEAASGYSKRWCRRDLEEVTNVGVLQCCDQSTTVIAGTLVVLENVEFWLAGDLAKLLEWLKPTDATVLEVRNDPPVVETRQTCIGLMPINETGLDQLDKALSDSVETNCKLLDELADLRNARADHVLVVGQLHRTRRKLQKLVDRLS